ncbi:AI-2E family transporter [Candidatus Peregrinibacteria bacterium]|nr:AI-2E family transporter [Candidatus Peregrinibacteria bacterium]
MQKNHAIVDIQKYFLVGILLVLVISLMTFISSFLSTLLIAGVIVTAIYPLHKLLNQKIHIPRSLSALLSLVLAAVIIIGPLILFFFMVANQAVDAYAVVSAKVSLLGQDFHLLPAMLQKPPFSEWIAKWEEYNPISASDLIQAAQDFVGNLSAILLKQTTNVLKNLSLFIVHAIVFFLAMFYFLRDGKQLIEYVKSLMPLSREYREELFNKLNHLSYAIIYGFFGTAIIQGFLVGFGFALVGISNAAFWGMTAGIFSFIPYIGTAVISIPAIIALLIGKHFIAALFLLIWSVAIVSTSDNVVKPYLIGASASLHPLAVLLVILGGAFAFGFSGLLFAPFVLTLALSFLHIYRLEYKDILDPGKEGGEKPKK